MFFIIFIIICAQTFFIQAHGPGTLNPSREQREIMQYEKDRFVRFDHPIAIPISESSNWTGRKSLTDWIGRVIYFLTEGPISILPSIEREFDSLKLVDIFEERAGRIYCVGNIIDNSIKAINAIEHFKQFGTHVFFIPHYLCSDRNQQMRTAIVLTLRQDTKSIIREIYELTQSKEVQKI